jgi:peptidoglycan hydrolase-like protein with peptidoglycan-binding domain
VAAVGSEQQMSRSQIFELQFRLNQLGFEIGEPNGRMTPRTAEASAAFAKKIGRAPGAGTPLLERAREAAVGIEGYSRKDGQVDVLVFTDEGTAQIVRVENWGLIRKSESSTYLRDRDRDGRPLINEHFDVRGMERRTNIPFEAWTSFGYKMYFPTPPRGERLEIEQVIVRPKIQKDGSVRTETIIFRNPFLRAPPPGPWYWYTGPEQETDARLQGSWTMTLGQKGKVLLSRAFNVGRL